MEPPTSNVILLLLIVDNDECMLGTHVCTQNCTNTAGSYTCSCNTGYTLNRDGRSCDGMHYSLCSLIF